MGRTNESERQKFLGALGCPVGNDFGTLVVGFPALPCKVPTIPGKLAISDSARVGSGKKKKKTLCPPTPGRRKTLAISDHFS